MGKINFARVLLGGIVAGLILNIGEWVLNGVVLAKDMSAFFKRCGFPEPGGTFLTIVIPLTFVVGIILVLGYAAIRSRFGAGPKTAVKAALFAWFGIYLYPNAVAFGLTMITLRLLVIALVWGLIEYIIASLVGAALYKEG